MAVRVLVVDDDRAVREALASLLTARGFEVAGGAGDAEMAVEAVRRLRPSAVVLDVHLGGTDGRALLHRLLAVQPGARILLTSSEAVVADDAAACLRGAVGFVLKDDLATADLARYLDA